MLQANTISKTIGGRSLLRNVSLSVQPGEIVSLIGPSGAGKTSLLRALSLVDPPDTGSLAIGDRPYKFPLSGAPRPAPYPELTVVFQQLFIWPHLTIRQNMTLPLRDRGDASHFDDITRLFQMSEFLDRYPNEVSIGQRQRAAIARALLLKPKYLLLDEVTSALDVEQAYLILAHLKEIAEKGVGILFVTHALHLAAKISSKIAFLDNGEITETGPGSILVSPHTERLKRFVGISEQVI